MTDPPTFDELASAHLDGATSPEEAALVAADPALQARVEELRAVRTALGEAPAVDPAAREAAIAAALAAFAEEGAPARSTATVTRMPARQTLSPRTIRMLSTAAVIALLALLVPLLAAIDRGADDAEMTFNSTGDAISGAGSDGATEADASDTTTVGGEAAPATARDLGTYADFDELAAAVSAGALDDAGGPDPQENGDAAFESFCPTSDAATESGTAVVAGATVLVRLVTAPDGTRTMTVLSPDDGCEILDRREL